MLCFGDSITQGFYGVWGPKNRNEAETSNVRFYPYSIRLGERLAGCSSIKAALHRAQTIAFSGYTSGELFPELQRALRAGPWRAAVICAGVNDAASEDLCADDIYDRVCTLIAACDHAGVPCVILPPLDCELDWIQYVFPDAKRSPQQRREVLKDVSDRLVAHCRLTGRPFVDSRTAVPYDLTNHGDLWDDTVHLSPAGSAKLGDAVFDVICAAGL